MDSAVVAGMDCEIYQPTNIAGNLTMGAGCRVDPYVTITGDVTLGDRVHLGVGVCIFGMGGVEIGEGSSISAGVRIYTGTDDLESGKLSNPCWPDRVVAQERVRIGRNCAIGANCVVMPGAVIEDGVVVGALSLVKGTLSAGRIFAGVPAKYITSSGVVY